MLLLHDFRQLSISMRGCAFNSFCSAFCSGWLDLTEYKRRKIEWKPVCSITDDTVGPSTATIFTGFLLPLLRFVGRRWTIGGDDIQVNQGSVERLAESSSSPSHDSVGKFWHFSTVWSEYNYFTTSNVKIMNYQIHSKFGCSFCHDSLYFIQSYKYKYRIITVYNK